MKPLLFTLALLLVAPPGGAAGISDVVEASRTDIDYWTAKYDGADLGKWQCAEPAIPDVSRSSAEVQRVTAAFDTWRSCHDAMIEHVNSLLPAGKSIPEDVAKLMSEQERQQAIARLNRIYRQFGEAQSRRASKITSDYQAWRKASARTRALK